MQLYPAGHTKNSITFVVFDRDRGSRNGFPGGAAASLTHTVTPYEWRIAYGVTPIGAEFPLSLSQQVFWNLDGLDSEDGTIADHTLSLPFSGLRLDTDDSGIPTGDIRGNRANSTLDFWSRPRKIGPMALDDTFLITRRQPWSMYTAPVASLESTKSGIRMDLYTDQEALHVTTWDKETGEIPLKNSHVGSSGEHVPVPRHAAVSLQMQDWTDAINHPEWQREDRVIWGTDRLYTMYSTYKFSVRKDTLKDS
jgi:aldose 1-epimerase